MNKKLEKIIGNLIMEDYMIIGDLSEKFNLDTTSMIHSIDEVNSNFKSEKVIISNKIIYIPYEYKVDVAQLFHIPIYEVTPIYKPQVRRDICYLKIALSNDYLSLDELAEHCLASKNTLTNDIKEINKGLKFKNVSVEYSRKKGFVIDGEELSIRAEIINIVDRMFIYQNGRNLLEEKAIKVKDDYFLLTERIRSMEEKTNITFSDEYLSKLPYLILIMIKRSEVISSTWDLSIKYQDLSNTTEFKEIENILWGYPDLSRQDITYLVMVFLGANQLNLKSELFPESEVKDFVDFIILKLEDKLVLNFKNSEFERKLLAHLNPALIRKRLGLTLENPLKTDFINRYYPVYEIVREIVGQYEKNSLSEDEIVYLSMIVLGHMYYVNNDEYRNNAEVSAAVVCHSGTSISELMNVQLKGMFPTIKFLGTYSERRFYSEEPNADIIFSTKPLKTAKPIFILKNLFDENSRDVFKKRVQKFILSDPQIKTNQLMNFLYDVIPKEKFEQIKEKTHIFFEENEEKSDQLEKLIQDYQVNYTESLNIFQMTEQGLNQLIERKSATENYKQETMSVFRERYEVMVIGPNVYLPHAHYDDGVLKEDFQLLIDKTEALCVLVLSPSKDNKHVKKLLHLNSLFTNENFMEKLFNSNIENVVELIEGSYRNDS